MCRSTGPQPGGTLYVPDVLNNREGPQTREPSKCLNGWSYRERLAKEAFRLPATRGSKKNSDRVITLAAKEVCVPVHLAPPGSLHAKQLHYFYAQLSLGQSCQRWKKKSLVFMCAASLRSCPTLQPYRWWPARFLCQRGGSPGKNTGTYWLILVAIPSRALYFLLP